MHTHLCIRHGVQTSVYKLKKARYKQIHLFVLYNQGFKEMLPLGSAKRSLEIALMGPMNIVLLGKKEKVMSPSMN
jgi:hypothetical protein